MGRGAVSGLRPSPLRFQPAESLRRRQVMKKLAITFMFIFALVVVAGAQKKTKPWDEWNEKEVQKMLNDSPWGQTQTETNTSEMVYSPSSQTVPNASRSAEGAYNQATNLNFRIRLLSAKPIRQAFARGVAMKNPQLMEKLRAFADQKSDQWIVVAVDYDSTDQRSSGKAMQTFNSAVTSALKNNTYLETKDGKRVFLQEYMAPIKDGMGAKFVFPRTIDEKPFVNSESGFLRFYSEMGSNIKLNMRFKISDMMYDGNLEYLKASPIEAAFAEEFSFHLNSDIRLGMLEGRIARPS